MEGVLLVAHRVWLVMVGVWLDFGMRVELYFRSLGGGG